MAYLKVKDGAGVTRWLAATGDGSEEDPFVVEHVLEGVRLIDENGDAYGVRHSENRPIVVAVTHGEAVAEGVLAGHTEIVRFGHNDGVPSSRETLWCYSEPYVYTVVAAPMYISSSDDGDAQSYEVEGLDADWAVQTQLVTVAGWTKTLIGAGLTWMRIFTVRNVGTVDNVGDVYVYEDDTLSDGVPDTAAKVRAMMEVGRNRSSAAIYSIPAGQVGYLTDFDGSEMASKQTHFSLWIRFFGGVFEYRHGWSVLAEPFSDHRVLPMCVPAKADIEMRARTPVGAGEAWGGFDGWREDV